MDLKIAIIIVSYNGEDFLFNCLNSLQKQNWPNYEIIVVDNKSRDDSIKIIKDNWPQIKIIANRKNLGFAVANNQGIDYALSNGADNIVLLNQDTVVQPDFLTSGIKVLQDKSIGLACPKILYKNSDKIWWAGSELYRGLKILTKPTIRLGRHIGKKKSDNKKYSQPTETDYITGCALFTRRDVINKIGQLDQKLFMYGEDVDWSFRAKKAGYKIIYFPTTTVWHDVPLQNQSPKGLVAKIFKAKNYFKGITVNLCRHYKFSEKIFWAIKLPFILPFMLIGILIKMIRN